jgi:hypothetical protein
MVTDAGACFTDFYELARALRDDRAPESQRENRREFDAVRLRVRSASPGTRHIDLWNPAISLTNGPSSALISGFSDPPTEAFWYMLNGYMAGHGFDVGYDSPVEKILPFPGQSNSVMYLQLGNPPDAIRIECGTFWEYRPGASETGMIPVNRFHR